MTEIKKKKKEKFIRISGISYRNFYKVICAGKSTYLKLYTIRRLYKDVGWQRQMGSRNGRKETSQTLSWILTTGYTPPIRKYV
jgi:hypothetical protein